MQVIEAALAFAVTMLVLSLVVSTLVETIHRVIGLREKGFESMLGQFYEQVLRKYAPNPAKSIEQARDDFEDRFSANRAPVGLKSGPDPDVPNLVQRPQRMELGRIWAGQRLAKLGVTEFMERLGGDEIGHKIAALGDDVREKVLQDIAQKFEAFGKEASTYFEARARLLSVVVAMVVAAALYVDAIDLFQTFLRDPAVRARVISQSEAWSASYKVADEQAKKLEAEVKKAAENAGALPETKKQLEELKGSFKNSLDTMRNTETQLRDLGVPISWTDERVNRANMWHVLWICPDPKDESMLWFWHGMYGKCAKENRQIWIQIPLSLRVYIGLLLGGLLIGLGGPFWYDFVCGLTNIRNVARSVSGTGQPEGAGAPARAPATGGAAPQPPPAPTSPQPQTPVDVFNVASKASLPGRLL